MTIRTYKVTLDTKNSIAPEPVFLRQGDKTGAVVIDATLMDNGAPISIDGLTPTFNANTADGQAVITDGTGFNIVDASGGEFTYQVPNALAAVPGKIVTAYFSLSDTSGSESTFDVAFVIKKAVDITQAQADDYVTIVDGTLQSLQQKIVAIQQKIAAIPKVAHLSGANNFDTVPTVNNNPLLLASSLPSDLARLSHDANFTAKLQQNGQDVALANNTIHRNPDTGSVSETNTFTAAQTFSIAPVINDASTDKGDNQAATMADLKSVEESAWRELDLSGTSGIYQGRILIKIDQANKYIYFIMNAQVPRKAYTKGTKIIDLSSIVTGLSSAHGYFQGWLNNLENPYDIAGSTIVVSGSSIELGNDYHKNSSGVSRIATEADPGKQYCYVIYDSLVNN